MVHTQVYDEYIHFSLMYTTDCIFHVIPIKNLVNQDGRPTMPQKLSPGIKPSVSNICVLLCLCVVQNKIAHVDTKALNMCYQSQNCFRGIFVEIPQNQQWCLIYIPIT